MIMEIHNMDIAYDKLVLEDVNATFSSGKIYTITGKSGIGKSSLLKAIYGMLDIKKGSLLIDKERMTFDKKNIEELRKEKIAYIAQEMNLINSMTTLENILFPIMLSNRKNNANDLCNIAEQLLIDLEISEYKDVNVMKLSGGERRRIEIVRAIAMNLKCIIADEITANLDNENVELIKKTLKNYVDNGGMIIMATHDARLNDIADEVYKIENRKLIKI